MSQIIAINDILVSESDCLAPGQLSVMRRYWKVYDIVGPGPVMFMDVASQLDSTIAPALKALIYNNAEYRGTRVRRRLPSGFDQWQADTSSVGAGTAGATGLPKQVAGLVSFAGLTIGKHGQGRVYAPFPSASDDTGDGTPTGGYLINLDALGVALTTDPILVTVGATQAKLHPGLFDPTAVTFTVIGSFTARGAWATQKRRGDYGRVNKPPF